MAERFKQIPKNLLNIWNKYNTRQKTLVISVLCTVIIAFVILFIMLGRVKYDVLTETSNSKEAAEVIELLKSEKIAYKLGTDKTTVSVDIKRYSDATLLLASNDMPPTGMTVEALLDNSLTTTNHDRNLKLNLYLQSDLRNFLITMEGVEDAKIYYIPVESNLSILSEPKDTTASVLINVNKDFEVDTAETIAEVVAAAIGNSNTEKIKVADQNGNLLYGGGLDLYSGSANSNEDFKERLTNTFINNLYMGLIKSGYDDVEIMPNLMFNLDKVTKLFTEYLPAEDQEQGVYGHSYTYNSENAGVNGGGIPGTSSNDETDYMMPDSSSSTGTVEIEEFDYLPNERVTNIEYEVGAVIPEESSISMVLRRIETRTEEELEAKGLLDDITFDEYVMNNNERIKEEVDPDIITMVSLATGISENNIQIITYVQPNFIPKILTVKDWTDYIQIALAILIIGFIVFVVFKGFGPVEVTELEPELSVEQLLATTKESQAINDIDFSEVSEVRKMIEKFVDEKPDAVASLLRNWLNEEWN